MPTVVTPIGQRVIVQGVSWATYTSLIADFAESRGTRMAYDRGTLEFMSPSFNHEQVADFLGDVVKAVAEAQALDFVPAGSMTFKRHDVERGFEPDASFYLQNAVVVQGQTTINLDVDPPPDVIIEVDLTHPSLDKFPIYAALGVPEVWRYAGQQVSLYRLVDDAYQEVAASTVLT
uniref:Uma2 family endonuclease n=1 Tax=Candidatus Entotheonella palauensis TaxID=93172 RepID=UPI000B7C579F